MAIWFQGLVLSLTWKFTYNVMKSLYVSEWEASVFGEGISISTGFENHKALCASFTWKTSVFYNNFIRIIVFYTFFFFFGFVTRSRGWSYKSLDEVKCPLEASQAHGRPDKQKLWHPAELGLHCGSASSWPWNPEESPSLSLCTLFRTEAIITDS